jgi:hypothetical protein
MALPGSGQLSLGDIAGELGLSLSNLSLRDMSDTAGFSTPDAVSEFYGYGSITYTYYAYYAAGDPCNFEYYDIYLGSDGVYYALLSGDVYDPMYNSTTDWYEFLYYQPGLDLNIYKKWVINSTSTTLTYDGNFSSSC